MCHRCPAAEHEGKPPVRQDASAEIPVLGRLGVAYRLDVIAVVVKPLGSGPMQRGNLARSRAPELQCDQVGEHVVVAKPRPAWVDRGHEGVGLLQLVQLPGAARGPDQQLGQLAVDPLENRGTQQHPLDVL
jgi:hypothetical protein